MKKLLKTSIFRGLFVVAMNLLINTNVRAQASPCLEKFDSIANNCKPDFPIPILSGSAFLNNISIIEDLNNIDFLINEDYLKESCINSCGEVQSQIQCKIYTIDGKLISTSYEINPKVNLFDSNLPHGILIAVPVDNFKPFRTFNHQEGGK